MKGKKIIVSKSPSLEGDLSREMQGFEHHQWRWTILPHHRIPYNPKLKERARELRKNMTVAEKVIWDYLKKTSLRVLRQRPIDNYIVDFYIASKKLVIEIDGAIHDMRKEYDFEREKVLQWYGLEVIRFSNEEVLSNFYNVEKKLKGVGVY